MPTAVTQIKRQATRIISSLGDEPVFITEHGQSTAVLLSVSSYETMQRKMLLLEGIARGERAIRDGRVASHKQAQKRLGKWR